MAEQLLSVQAGLLEAESKKMNEEQAKEAVDTLQGALASHTSASRNAAQATLASTMLTGFSWFAKQGSAATSTVLHRSVQALGAIPVWGANVASEVVRNPKASVQKALVTGGVKALALTAYLMYAMDPSSQQDTLSAAMKEQFQLLIAHTAIDVGVDAVEEAVTYFTKRGPSLTQGADESV